MISHSIKNAIAHIVYTSVLGFLWFHGYTVAVFCIASFMLVLALLALVGMASFPRVSGSVLKYPKGVTKNDDMVKTLLDSFRTRPVITNQSTAHSVICIAILYMYCTLSVPLLAIMVVNTLILYYAHAQHIDPLHRFVLAEEEAKKDKTTEKETDVDSDSSN